MAHLLEANGTIYGGGTDFAANSDLNAEGLFMAWCKCSLLLLWNLLWMSYVKCNIVLSEFQSFPMANSSYMLTRSHVERTIVVAYICNDAWMIIADSLTSHAYCLTLICLILRWYRRLLSCEKREPHQIHLNLAPPGRGLRPVLMPALRYNNPVNTKIVEV